MTDETAGDDLAERLGERIARGLDGIFGRVNPADVFRTLESSDDRVVLGASTIERAGGFGFGAGEGVDSAGERGAGGGGGGGGMGSARPVAVVEVSASGVQVWPVVDYTKLGLAIAGTLVAIWKASR